MPLPWLGVGVKTAVLKSPLPEMAVSVPPETCTSPAAPSHVKLLPGSSENENVMLAVTPAFKTLTSEVMTTVGAVVSTKKSGLALIAACSRML